MPSYYHTPQAESTVPASFTMHSVSELDVLLFENKNEMKIIFQLPLFIYLGDSEFISQGILRFKRMDKKYRFLFNFSIFKIYIIIVWCVSIGFYFKWSCFSQFNIYRCWPTVTATDTNKLKYTWVSENGQWNCSRNVHWNHFQIHLQEGNQCKINMISGISDDDLEANICIKKYCPIGHQRSGP